MEAGMMALLARCLRAEEDTPRGKPFRVAIIGYGEFGAEYLVCCLDLQKESIVEVAAICDIRGSTIKRDILKRQATPEQVSACHFYSDPRKMLKEEAGRLDVAFVCSPDSLHREHVEACLNAGLHVFCELPLADNVANARSMFQTAKRSGRLLSGHFYSEPFPAYRYVRDELIRRHKIFPPVTYLRAVSPNPLSYDFTPTEEVYIRKVENTYRKKGTWGTQEDLKESPFQSFYELVKWPIIRKFGIGSELRAIYEHVGMMLDFMGGLPVSVSMRESPSDPRLLPRVTLFRFKDNTLAESVLFGNHRFLDLFDRDGWQIHVSPFHPKNTYVRCGWRFNPPGEKGILGKQIDMSYVDYMDLRSIIQWESNLPEAEKKREEEKLEEEYRQYAGEDNVWQLPDSIINTRKDGAYSLRMRETLLSFFRKTDTPDTAFAEKAFIAQVIIDGVEQALKTGKPFTFSPEMFALP
ncbi:MAG: Gfo/Idh/MocA family oxidoreductase [Kiritimatiellae bacterium]|nr:Gfo/Idh/MocA family oxidoreductase [Kiritimatiellia bacterium]